MLPTLVDLGEGGHLEGAIQRDRGLHHHRRRQVVGQKVGPGRRLRPLPRSISGLLQVFFCRSVMISELDLGKGDTTSLVRNEARTPRMKGLELDLN